MPAFEKAELLREFHWNPDWVTAVSFLGSTRRLFAGNRLGEILEWELPEKLEPEEEGPDPIRSYHGHDNAITKLLSTKDGKELYSASFDHTLRRWDLETKPEKEEKIVLNAGTIYRQQFKRSGKKEEPVERTVAVCSKSKNLGGHEEWINALVLSWDETLLVSGDDGGKILIRERSTGKERQSWEVEGWVHALAFSPDNKQAVVSERRPLVFDSAQRQAIKLWDVEKGEELKDLTEEYKKHYLSALAWSPDGETIAVGKGEEADGIIWLLDAKDGKQRKKLDPVHRYGVTDFAFHPDGKHLFSCGRDTVIRIWDFHEGKLVKELGKPRGGQYKDWIHAISLNHDGTLLAAADMAGQVNLWRLA